MTSDLIRAAVRLLAMGAPVSTAQLADAAGVEVAELTSAPAAKDIEYDDEGRIVGWGLTLIPTPHAFLVDGHQLYTWCAADTLLFPAIIGSRARVESRCPATNVVICLTMIDRKSTRLNSSHLAVSRMPSSA